MAKEIKTLSKSKLMRGVQCEKNLWLTLHKPELEPETDKATQKQFDEGNEVGEKAREIEGKGLLIDNDYWDYSGAHKRTQDAIASGVTPIYEAAFLADDGFARADILKKTKTGWHLIEVKKSTGVKDYHFQDAAIQTAIIESSGLKLKSISIRHINNEMLFPDIKNLFTTVDVTDDVRSLQIEIKSKIKHLHGIIKMTKEPNVEISSHCNEPFGCAFKDYCWKHVPEKSVFDLPQLATKKKWELFNKDIQRITDLDPKNYKGVIRRAIEVTKSKKLFVDSKGIASELKQWKWPLYFFDYETIGPAVPRYDNTKPYAQIPFQFSCHVWSNAKTKNLDHFEYLHTDPSDPRPFIIKAMLKDFGKKGSIVAYNKSFEIGVIKRLVEFDKKNKDALLALCERFVDPLPIVKESVYHPDFLGSFSIKSVAPALIGNKFSYEGLIIGDGGAAQSAAELVLSGQAKGKEKDQIVEDLLKYCRQDTLAMVEIVKWLMGRVA